MSKISLKPGSTGTGTYTIEAPAGDLSKTLVLPDEDGTLTTAEQVLANKITLATAKTATGTYVDFTGIPSWAKRITVMFDGVSTNGTSTFLIRIGGSSLEITGYNSSGANAANVAYYDSTGFKLSGANAATGLYSGAIILNKINNNTWCSFGILGGFGPVQILSSGSKTLSEVLSQLRITTTNGTDQFDAGTINISWE